MMEQQSVFMSFAGGDLGNDSLKLIVDPQYPILIRNTVSRRPLDEQRKDLTFDSGLRMTRKRDIDGLDVIIEPHGQMPTRYYIGDLAVKAGENKVEVGTPKADNPYIHIPLLAMLAYSVPEEYTVARFKIVVGLPIKQYVTKENRKKMKQRLCGQYKVTLLDKKDRVVELIIEDVTVVPEGVAVLMNQMLNEHATAFSRPELQKGQYGVVDIGAFTTDIPVIEDGSPNSLVSDGEDIGIASYLDRIADGLRSKYRANITRNQLVERLEKKDFKMMIRGKEIDLKPDFDASLMEFSNWIVGIIDKIWQQMYEIKEWFIVGGGAKVLEPYLRDLLKNRDFDLTFIYRSHKDDHQNDPQLQNAYGYWKIAKTKYGG